MLIYCYCGVLTVIVISLDHNRCRASPGAVATLVVCEAVHMCMVARGVEKHASSTVTCAARGACKANGELRTDLLKILNSASFC